MAFRQLLERAWTSSGSLLCVGLDPDLAQLPACVLREPDPVFAFNRAIIDATARHVCAYKLQNAYYVGIGAERALERTIDYLRVHHAGKCIVLDAKRNDIGATARLYAREAFERYDADAVTVSPYLGIEGIAPFLERPERGCFVLCRTSNPGSDRIQAASTPPLYWQIAELAAREWNGSDNVGLVVGATNADVLADLRQLVGEMPILVPGIGAQGGDLVQTMRGGATTAGGLLISSSRAILYASTDKDFAEAAGAEAASVHAAIAALRRGSNLG